jgi:hypothetical protein
MRPRYRAVVLIFLGLAIGLAIGLYLGWEAWPTQFTDASPRILRDEYRHDYLLMIAHAYELDGDLAAARRRLYTLQDEEPDRYLLTTTVDAILSGRDEATEIRPLVGLASDLGLESPAMAPYLQTPENDGDVQE